MTAINIATAAEAPGVSLPTAAWDFLSFLENAKNYGEQIGGGFISLVGLIIIIVAGYFVAKRFLSKDDRGEKSWMVIVLMLIIGGAFLTGGIALLMNLSSGGQKTIEDLGGGLILFNYFGLGR